MDTPSDIYPRFQVTRSLTRFAGVLGAIQSAIWIAFAIVGFLAYFCILDYSNIGTNLDSAVQLTFFEIYFHGTCEVKGLPDLDFQDLREMSVLKPNGVHICLWIYLLLNVFWLMSSISLIRNVDEDHLRRTNILLYIWIFITLDISGLDLGLSIVFGLDYDKYLSESSSEDIKDPTFDAVKLGAAKVAAMTMLIMAIKGFLLWVTNVCFAIFFFVETFAINEASISQTSLMNKDVISDTQSVSIRPPLVAYEASNPQQQGFQIRLHTEALERANKMSVLSLKERFENRKNSDPNRFRAYAPNWEPNVPNPDYTPPMQRSQIYQRRDDYLHGKTKF